MILLGGLRNLRPVGNWEFQDLKVELIIGMCDICCHGSYLMVSFKLVCKFSEMILMYFRSYYKLCLI